MEGNIENVGRSTTVPFIIGLPVIGHFRVPKTLTLKTRPSAKPFL